MASGSRRQAPPLVTSLLSRLAAFSASRSNRGLLPRRPLGNVPRFLFRHPRSHSSVISLPYLNSGSIRQVENGKTSPAVLTTKADFCNISRRMLSSTNCKLQEIHAEEPSSWRLFPSRGEAFEEEVQVGPHVVSFETGKLAKFAAGAVVVGIKDTKVLATVVSANNFDESKGFMPMQVDYRERNYAQGKIPNTFMRREGAPKERELLVGRVIDRSIRPLFPKGYYYETQVMANVLCSDGEQDPDILAANAASAALLISDIPWNGPVGVVRIGRVEGRFVVNPDMDELAQSDLNLVYACTMEKTVMIETQAREISNEDLIAAMKLAHSEASKMIAPQLRLAEKVQSQKRQVEFQKASSSLLEKVHTLASSAIQQVMSDPSYGKFERGKALSKVEREVADVLKAEGDTDSLKLLSGAFDQVRKQIVRENIFKRGLRVDGRGLDEVRDLYSEVGIYSLLHGSSLFSRGNTQVLCTVTLGAAEDAQTLDSIVGPPRKRFMVHYSFPPFCINEVGKPGGLSRREVGHGTLAEKALLALLPPEAGFPYTVRLNSEVMASDGSSSMATVCGGSIALMDAGVPLREHVAGVSVGLVTERDPTTDTITDYRILTDILGLEDHIGDMDFKIAGTKNGITAIQLDIKPAGIPLDILCEALEPAQKARMHILEMMNKEIKEPRQEQKDSAPKRGNVTVPRESVARIIGPSGVNVKRIARETGARIQVNYDGCVSIFARNQALYDQAKDMVEASAGKEIEIGNIYDGVVSAIKDFGAFIELMGNQGLLHISEISHEKLTRVSDALCVGQQIKVMCIGRDFRGNLKLSLKAMMPLVEAEIIVKDLPGSVVCGTEENLSEEKTFGSVYSDGMTSSSPQNSEPTVSSEVGTDGANEKTEALSPCNDENASVMPAQKEEVRTEGETNGNVQVKAGESYIVEIHDVRKFGAVLRMSDGTLGKMFYGKEGPSRYTVGEKVHVICKELDPKGRPVFTLNS